MRDTRTARRERARPFGLVLAFATTLLLTACGGGGGGGDAGGGGGTPPPQMLSLAPKATLTDADYRHFLQRTHFGFSQTPTVSASAGCSSCH